MAPHAQTLSESISKEVPHSKLLAELLLHVFASKERGLQQQERFPEKGKQKYSKFKKINILLFTCFFFLFFSPLKN